jgi:hypothetical protein
MVHLTGLEPVSLSLENLGIIHYAIGAKEMVLPGRLERPFQVYETSTSLSMLREQTVLGSIRRFRICNDGNPPRIV